MRLKILILIIDQEEKNQKIKVSNLNIKKSFPLNEHQPLPSKKNISVKDLLSAPQSIILIYYNLK